jgi:hypothetical protein
MMTCIIGLSTSAYSNTIDGMTQEFGVANVVGQVGMFSASTTPRFLLALLWVCLTKSLFR